MSHENENRKMVFAEQLRAIMNSRKTPDGKKLTQQHIADAVHVQREGVIGVFFKQKMVGDDSVLDLVKYGIHALISFL